MVGKTAGSAQIDAVATNCTGSLCILHHYKLNFLKKLVLLNVFDEAVEIVY